MGQYHKLVNFDKREYVNPHVLGCGLKAMEQAWTGPDRGGGTTAALFFLMLGSCKGGSRGGGDVRTDIGGGVVGRWAGDRVAMLGDYAIKGDCGDIDLSAVDLNEWTDISLSVAELLEEQYGGKFSGSGWRCWQKTGPGR